MYRDNFCVIAFIYLPCTVERNLVASNSQADKRLKVLQTIHDCHSFEII